MNNQEYVEWLEKKNNKLFDEKCELDSRLAKLELFCKNKIEEAKSANQTFRNMDDYYNGKIVALQEILTYMEEKCPFISNT